MNEHGWPEHDDDPHDHDDSAAFDDAALPEPELLPDPDDDGLFGDAVPGHEPPPPVPMAVPMAEPIAEAPPAPGWEAAGVDPDAVGGDDPVAVFPPPVDVGPLPEPVDGFPWIDTGSLGMVDPAAGPAAPADPMTPQELADYAAADLPPGVDPWAALADSDDPATAALARWWSPPGN